MRVFITGASGWVGSSAVREFIDAGHEVVGLVRAESAGRDLEARGAVPLRGDLDDLDSLRRGAAESDAVVHLANKHDWSDPAGTNAAERAAVQTLGEALVDSDRPLLVASGIAGVVRGRAVREDDASPAVGIDSMRGGSENLTLDFADRGVRAMVARLAPTVHGAGDRRGFVPDLVRAARRNGAASFIEDGANGWSAVHHTDAARLIRLGIEQAPAGSRLHAVAEERMATRAVAEAIAEMLALPVRSIRTDDVAELLGPTGRFFGLDITGTSDATRALTGWAPVGPTLLEDLAAGAYRDV